jgi:hypothetical protein
MHGFCTQYCLRCLLYSVNLPRCRSWKIRLSQLICFKCSPTFRQSRTWECLLSFLHGYYDMRFNGHYALYRIRVEIKRGGISCLWRPCTRLVLPIRARFRLLPCFGVPLTCHFGYSSCRIEWQMYASSLVLGRQLTCNLV